MERKDTSGDWNAAAYSTDHLRAFTGLCGFRNQIRRDYVEPSQMFVHIKKDKRKEKHIY